MKNQFEIRTDVWFNHPTVTIQQHHNSVNVSIQEFAQGITEVKISAESLKDVLACFEDRFEGNTKVAVNFNYGETSVWFHTEHADAIMQEIGMSADIGIRQTIHLEEVKAWTRKT